VGESAADIKSLARVSVSPWFVSSARLLQKFIYLFPFQKAACIISTDEVLCLLPQVYSKKAAVRTINYSGRRFSTQNSSNYIILPKEAVHSVLLLKSFRYIKGCEFLRRDCGFGELLCLKSTP
jgi:hypothetical protein